MRVLIIEDDTSTARLLAMMIEDMGFEVCGCEATQEGAIKAAERFAPNLMIADVNLRIGSGIDAVKEILRNATIPHIFVSADLTLVRAQNPTAIMLQKPYVYTQMSEAIWSATVLAA
jgi:two-component system, response regulator PdtaR